MGIFSPALGTAVVQTRISLFYVGYIYNGILFSLKKEGMPVICNNMDEPGGHHAK